MRHEVILVHRRPEHRDPIRSELHDIVKSDPLLRTVNGISGIDENYWSVWLTIHDANPVDALRRAKAITETAWNGTGTRTWPIVDVRIRKI